MKRRLFKLVVFLILGAIVNVAVAWGCAIYSKAPFALTTQQSASIENLELLQHAGWKQTSESDDWRYTHSTFEWRGYGVSEYYIIEDAVEQDDSRMRIGFTKQFTFYIAGIYQAGWPLRCLSREHLDTSGNGQGEFTRFGPWRPEQNPLASIGNSPIDGRSETPIENWQHSMSLPVPRKIGPVTLPVNRYIPLRPIWNGLIINTFIYALILGMMMFIASMAKQHRRFKNGHCPKCNYQLRRDYSCGCPECGWGREAEA